MPWAGETRTLLVLINRVLYSWISSLVTVWRYVSDTWDIFAATSVFSHDRITDKIFPFTSKNFISIRFYIAYFNCEYTLSRMWLDYMSLWLEFSTFQPNVTWPWMFYLFVFFPFPYLWACFETVIFQFYWWYSWLS